jgi:GTP-binding protein EngB required for normal cell division
VDKPKPSITTANTTSSISSKANKNIHLTIIQRRAVDSSGRIGSLYDANLDCLLSQLSAIAWDSSIKLYNSVRCELIIGSIDKSQNLLKMIGIDDDLRLNIRLNVRPGNGIAAVINHPSPVGKYTRFLYFFYINREERLLDDPTKAKKSLKLLAHQATATHIITDVTFGIDIVVVLQLSHKGKVAADIDIVLEKIRARLANFNDTSDFIEDDLNILEKITETKAYSNASELTKMASLLQICQYINGCKKKPDAYPPVNYTLQPIEWLYPMEHGSNSSYISLKTGDSDYVEKHLISLSNRVKQLKYSLREDIISQHFEHLKEQADVMQIQWQNVKKAYEAELERLRGFIFDIHNGKKRASDIDQALREGQQLALNDSIREMEQQINNLKEKGKFIIDLQNEYCDYYNVAQHNRDKDVDEETLKQKLIDDDEYSLTLCSSDTLRNGKPEIWDDFYGQLSGKRQKNPNLRLRYADFSYCAFQLRKTVILTNKQQKKNELVEQNILLLGESGVGKSTFVNAFVNYLKFKTFEEAETNKPVVLIPVSFLITTGHNFEEHIVKFGESDNLNNEDFDHPGQSVTQQCTSYIFSLNNMNGNKLRITDTPGFGDTRGIDQDDLNMKHILEYINNFTHINAVCFLLKSDASQINNFFQTCLTQLLDLLGPNARQNIIFCFTNARSTFYAPGDTAPLLKDILKSVPVGDIPFNKKNTFCFDNESFRYLVALQNLITFDDQDKTEYEMSWSTSVKESKRLYDYICNNLSACSMRDEQQSIKRAQLQIIPMIRPMLETMRNILRNMIMCKMDSLNKTIELSAEALRHPAAICSACKHDSMQKGPFWITRDEPHEIQKTCCACTCPLNQHITAHYKLEYEYSDSSSNYNRDEMKKKLNLLRHASIEFAHFLMHVARSSKDDPFWIGIAQMIGEENYLSKNRKSNELNLQLGKHLGQLKIDYEGHTDKMQSNREHSKLSTIYDWIQTVGEHRMVQVQMAAFKKTQKRIMKLYEYEVPEVLMNTSIRSKATS